MKNKRNLFGSRTKMINSSLPKWSPTVSSSWADSVLLVSEPCRYLQSMNVTHKPIMPNYQKISNILNFVESIKKFLQVTQFTQGPSNQMAKWLPIAVSFLHSIQLRQLIRIDNKAIKRYMSLYLNNKLMIRSKPHVLL